MRAGGFYHVCAVPGCGATIPRSLVMCRPHWFRVPMRLQRRAVRAWRLGAGVESAEYRTAIRDAIESLDQLNLRDGKMLAAGDK